ncbi:MAG: PolC-type DNA polymerase III, partial [Clostridia bacterium]
GAVRIEHGEIVGQFHRMVRAARPLSAESRLITQITDADLSQAEDPATVWEAFRAFAGGAILVAHNAAFDRGFLVPVMGPDWPFADTLALSRVLVTDVKGYGLEPLTDYFHIPLVEHHRALHDAEAAGRLWIALWATPAGQALQAQVDWWTAAAPVAVRAQRPIPVLVYPRTQEGLQALYRMVSDSHLQTFWRVPRVRWSALLAHRDVLLLGAPAIGGELTDLLFRNGSGDEWGEAAARYDFAEVVPPAALADLESDGMLSSRGAVEDLIRELDERAAAAGLAVIAASDAHYRRPGDRVYREVLQATAKGEMHAARGALHYRTAAEMKEELHFLGTERAEQLTVAAPRTLLQRIDAGIMPVPEGLHAPHLQDAERVVSERPYAVAREQFGDVLPVLVEQRLQHEIDAIVRHGFASVYYTAHRLVEKSLEDGYLVGSRGSVGSSLVATYLNITEVNPLPPHYRCPACHYVEFFTRGEVGSGFDLPPKPCPTCGQPLTGDGQDIPFETFLGFEGDKVPDIDLNFSGEYQPVIHRYTEELFGAGQVYRAGTIATIAERTAFGLVKGWARETGRTLPPVEVDRLSQGILGVKRTTGQHPGGLMVVPEGEDIHRFTPVQRPADALDAEVITTHFDYHAIEGRLLKLDLLGHEDPTTLRMLSDLTGVDLRRVPFQDADTMALFSGLKSLGLSEAELGSPVGSLGLPEFGTPFVRRMLADTRPTTFAELVRISGLSHGTNVWVSNAEELIRKKLASLSDVIATRDDIMTFLIRTGLQPQDAFAISERVRRGRGVSPEQEALMHQHGVPDWYVDSCQRITYLFPKAHAAAYVMMGWRIAWFKVHHPLAFYAVYCTAHGADFAAETALGGIPALEAESRRIDALGLDATPKERSQQSLFEVLREMALRGFGFKPVSLMLSDAARFIPTGDHDLLIPFAALSGVGRQAAESIVQARQDGPFLSIDDLRQRSKLSRTVLDLLRQAGALDGLGESRQLALF